MQGLTLHIAGGTAGVALTTPATQTLPRGRHSDDTKKPYPTHPQRDTISCILCLFSALDRYPRSFLLYQPIYRLTQHPRPRHSRNGSINTRSTRPPCAGFIWRPASIRRREYTKPSPQRLNNAIVDQRRRCAQLYAVRLPSCYLLLHLRLLHCFVAAQSWHEYTHFLSFLA